MSENIYELMNGIETDLTEYQAGAAASDTDKKRWKKNIRSSMKTGWSRKGKGLAAAACLAVCIAGLGMGPLRYQTEAAARLLSYNIQTALGVKKDLARYEKVVNQSVTKDGTTVTLNKVILDRETLIVSTTEMRAGEASGLSGVIYINGRRVDGGASGSSKNTGSQIRESVMEYDIYGIDTEGELNIELELYAMDESAPGWKFAFAATGSELRADTLEIPLEAGFQLPDGSYVQLDAMTSNDVGQKIYFTLKDRKTSYNIKLEGQDNLGNPVVFDLSRGRKDGGRLNIDNLSSSLDPDADSITLKPYAAAIPEASGKLSDDWEQAGEAFTIQLK